MPHIQHVSLADYQQGNFLPAQIAIRIADSQALFGEDKTGQVVYRFIFADVDEGRDDQITALQANDIVNILIDAKQKSHNVLVHCVAGISRSGAIAQFAIDYLGFDDVILNPYMRNNKVWRLPNAGVLKSLRFAYQGDTDYDAIFAHS